MIGQNVKLLCSVVFICTYSLINAQDHIPELFPQPQITRISQERFSPLGAYQLSGNKVAGADVLLNELLSVHTATGRLTFEINQLNAADRQLQRSGAYRLRITPSKISLDVFDRRSTFYALQTLRQLIRKEGTGKVSLPIGEIIDYPDVAYRGTTPFH